MASGSVSESMAEYTVTVQSSVAGERSNGLVEIYTLQGNSTRVGYATGIVATSMSWKFFSKRIFYPEKNFFINFIHSFYLCLAGEDYDTVSEPVIFNPGSTEFNYPITLHPDDQFEGGDELLIIGLRATGAGGVVISQGQFTLTITEDDSRSHDMSHDKHVLGCLDQIIMIQCFQPIILFQHKISA